MKRSLFILDSKDKVRVFEVEVKENTQSSAVITRTGLVNGKLIEKVEVINKGKQGRTVVGQAEFVASSKYSEKLDEGYKSVAMMIERLENTNIDFHILEDEEESIIFLNLSLLLPNASTTNGHWDELPMLAHKYKDIKKFNFPYIGQPKLNGVRCLAKLDNHKKSIKLCSRGGQYYQIPHIQGQLLDLYSLLSEHIEASTDDILLDGEIYVHGAALQDISGAARLESDSMFSANLWLEYHIYDIIDSSNSLKQGERINNLLTLNNIITNFITRFKSIKVVNNVEIKDKDSIDYYHNTFLLEGYEGLILRDYNAYYEFNQRSYNLIKVKQYQDEEFTIVGYEIDEAKTLEESFVFVLRNNINDKLFKARPTGTKEMKAKWWYESNKGTYEGKKATVRFFERSKEGIPMQTCVRHNLTNCLIEHIRPQGE